MTGDRVYWLQLGAGNAVIGSGAVQGAEAIAVTLGKPGRVEVSAEIAAQLRQGGAWVWNGSALEPAPAAMTEDDRARALWEADHMAEAARRPFLSAGAGQAMEYLLTLDEAQRFIGYAGPASDYPLLAAEQSALQAAGQTVPLATVAANIVAADRATRQQLAAIKLARRVRKTAIRAATTPAEINAALDQGIV